MIFAQHGQPSLRVASGLADLLTSALSVTGQDCQDVTMTSRKRKEKFLFKTSSQPGGEWFISVHVGEQYPVILCSCYMDKDLMPKSFVWIF